MKEALRLALEALEMVCEHGAILRPIETRDAIKAALEAKDGTVTVYGYCPICNAKGLSRERHPNGSDVCTNGHIYESKYALTAPPQRTWVGLTDEHKEGLIYMTDPNPEPHHLRELIDVIEFQLKEKNT